MIQAFGGIETLQIERIYEAREAQFGNGGTHEGKQIQRF